MDDLISRQEVLTEISRWRGYLDDDMIMRISIGIKRLPAAQPQRMKGKWIDITNDESIDYEYKCSKCGFKLFLWSNLTNYCPNCGSDMRGEQNG